MYRRYKTPYCYIYFKESNHTLKYEDYVSSRYSHNSWVALQIQSCYPIPFITKPNKPNRSFQTNWVTLIDTIFVNNSEQFWLVIILIIKSAKRKVLKVSKTKVSNYKQFPTGSSNSLFLKFIGVVLFPMQLFSWRHPQEFGVTNMLICELVSSQS